MSGDNMKETILKGGHGGKGNMNYATANHAGSSVCTARTGGT